MKTASKKVINGWAMYDWANSVYNLVITTTFFPIYFLAVTKEHVSFLGMNFVNSALYNYTMAAAYLLVAFSSLSSLLLRIPGGIKRISCVFSPSWAHSPAVHCFYLMVTGSCWV
jgi:hypothetical protein